MAVKLAIIERLVQAEPAFLELPTRVADWPKDWREEYEETILEFEDNLSRADAEQWADTIVRAAYRLHHKQSDNPGM